MLGIFRRSAHIGTVTSGYPRHNELAPAAFRGTPLLDARRCDGNAACVAVCPSAALALDADAGQRRLTLDLARCISCGRCVEVCTPGALTIRREFELASHTRHDLLSVVNLPKNQTP
jgi:formate hydrogenlyase subunit 6/NADH:ubiquinone oxidoreductase subunit I